VVRTGALDVLTAAGATGGLEVGVAGAELVCTAAAEGVGVPLGFDNVFAVALGVTAKVTTPTISSTINATPTTMSARLNDLGTHRGRARRASGLHEARKKSPPPRRVAGKYPSQSVRPGG
jgi:hypothetical protein